MKPLKIHYLKCHDFTITIRCGISGDTHQIVTSPRFVTCKRCKRGIEFDDSNKIPVRSQLFGAVIALLLLTLSACGTAQSPRQPQVTTASFKTQDLEVAFGETKECSGMEYGGYDDLVIEAYEDRVWCDGAYRYGCFRVPNIIQVVVQRPDGPSERYVFQHEVGHYLIYSNHGRVDKSHDEFSIWRRCL